MPFRAVAKSAANDGLLERLRLASSIWLSFSMLGRVEWWDMQLLATWTFV